MREKSNFINLWVRNWNLRLRENCTKNWAKRLKAKLEGKGIMKANAKWDWVTCEEIHVIQRQKGKANKW